VPKDFVPRVARVTPKKTVCLLLLLLLLLLFVAKVWIVGNAREERGRQRYDDPQLISSAFHTKTVNNAEPSPQANKPTRKADPSFFERLAKTPTSAQKVDDALSLSLSHTHQRTSGSSRQGQKGRQVQRCTSIPL
jgi:hypothetical protein